MAVADPYTVLGVAPDADDAAIRARYLALTREFPPEQHAERFASIRTAYETIKSFDLRVKRRVFPDGQQDSLESIIEEVACRTPRTRITLDSLLATAYPKVLR
ncbi:hypothetical protein BH11PLA2_BH11PLA2_08060 [soil metagenome]